MREMSSGLLISRPSGNVVLNGKINFPVIDRSFKTQRTWANSKLAFCTHTSGNVCVGDENQSTPESCLGITGTNLFSTILHILPGCCVHNSTARSESINSSLKNSAKAR